MGWNTPNDKLTCDRCKRAQPRAIVYSLESRLRRKQVCEPCLTPAERREIEKREPND